MDVNGRLKTYTLSMEDKMAAGAFGCARKYGWDSSFKFCFVFYLSRTISETLVVMFTLSFAWTYLSRSVKDWRRRKSKKRNSWRNEKWWELLRVQRICLRTMSNWTFCFVFSIRNKKEERWSWPVNWRNLWKTWFWEIWRFVTVWICYHLRVKTE